MAETSAGILMFRRKAGSLQVLLVHPGGPFWSKKDLGAWSVPKGERRSGEEPQAAALREFEEELGSPVQGHLISLRPVRQKGGKEVLAWAVDGNLDTSKVRSNEFEMEWPPKSGKRQRFPEIDRAEWFDLDVAAKKINPAQVAFLDELAAKLAGEPPAGEANR
jgi:predicted NUDIX family NTP pyrophosphohydrolase